MQVFKPGQESAPEPSALQLPRSGFAYPAPLAVFPAVNALGQQTIQVQAIPGGATVAQQLIGQITAALLPLFVQDYEHPSDVPDDVVASMVSLATQITDEVLFSAQIYDRQSPDDAQTL